MNLAGFLMAIAGNLAYRVLAALGIGIVSFAGLSAIITMIQNKVFSAMNTIPPAPLAIANIAGLTESITILISGLIARQSISAIKQFRFL